VTDRPASRLFAVPENVTLPGLLGRAALLLVLSLWGLRFLGGSPDSTWIADSFLHGVDLVIHEAGHVIFGPLGWFIGVLGGSLLQILIPALFAGAFLWKYSEPFGAAVATWWLGQNFMDLAPYVNDARSQSLMLLGGVTGRDAPGYHDWNNILGQWGLLASDHLIARIFYDVGRAMMVAAILWGIWLLLLQYKKIEQ